MKVFVLIVSLISNLIVIGQNSQLKVSTNEMEIPLNVELKISVKVNSGKLEKFKLISDSEVEKPLDLMEALGKDVRQEHISNEIEFMFCEADLLGSKSIALTTVHHLEKSIKFKAKIKIKDRKELVETSIVTKHSNVFSVEQWQEKIELIILYDFEFVED